MTRLIVWRHGQTEWNSSARIQGHADVPLDDVGRAQAVTAAAVLTTLRPDLIVSSDLRRAAETATALASVTGLPVHYDARLRERFFGDWQGLTNDEVAADYPADFAAWRRGESPNGFGIESLDDLTKRVTEATLEAADAGAGGTVIVTTHGGAAKYLLSGLLGWPQEVTARVSGLSNCHWTDLRYDTHRGWVMRGHNVGRLVD